MIFRVGHVQCRHFTIVCGLCTMINNTYLHNIYVARLAGRNTKQYKQIKMSDLEDD